jgi:hypothetical protein
MPRFVRLHLQRPGGNRRDVARVALTFPPREKPRMGYCCRKAQLAVATAAQSYDALIVSWHLWPWQKRLRDGVGEYR